MAQRKAASPESFLFSRFLHSHADEPPAVRITHARVFLRPPQAEDWRPWADLRTLSRDFLTPWEPTWSKDALTRGAYRGRLRAYARDWRNDRSYSFLIIRQTDNRLLGGLTVNNVRRGIVQSGSFGYWIGKPRAGQGYMREALIAGLKFCFDHLKLHRVEAACLLKNDASRRVLLAVGFEQEGLARSYLKIDGRWQDHYTFAALRRDVAERLDQARIT